MILHTLLELFEPHLQLSVSERSCGSARGAFLGLHSRRDFRSSESHVLAMAVELHKPAGHLDLIAAWGDHRERASHVVLWPLVPDPQEARDEPSPRSRLLEEHLLKEL